MASPLLTTRTINTSEPLIYFRYSAHIRDEKRQNKIVARGSSHGILCSANKLLHLQVARKRFSNFIKMTTSRGR